MSAGQDFAKKIGPIGGGFFLLLFVIFLVYCFTAGTNPIPGYEAPHDSSYYSQNDTTLAELKTELETNVFPKINGIGDCQIVSDKLTITIDSANYSKSRSAILKYYDKSLFEFLKTDS